jgi:hypothetical protein
MEVGDTNNLPRHCRTAFIDQTIYIKSSPTAPHERGVQGLAVQFTSAFHGINHRLGADILINEGSPDYHLGTRGSVQADLSIKRVGRMSSSFLGEISHETNTTQLINQCRRHFQCNNVQYVLGIDILDILDTDVTQGRIRLVAHLFRRGVHNNLAPETITYFGNSTCQEEGYLNNLLDQHYSEYRNAIQIRGIGFRQEGEAPPSCSQGNLPEYLLFFDPNMLLRDDHGLNLTGIPLANQSDLPQRLFIDLYEVQRRIRLGFYSNHTFPGEIPPELHGI